MDDLFQQLSDSVGFPVDQLKYLTCLLTCYPAAYIFKSLPKNAYTIKHLYSIVLSISFTVFCLGPTAWIHSFASSFVTYLILKFLPHGVAHKVAFVWVLGYMSLSHLYRQYVDYLGWKLDFTTMQMVLTIKLTSFAYNYYDGNRPESELTKEQKKRSIKELPNLLEFFGFVYFFCSFLAGPAIEITEYQNYINWKMFDDKKCNGKIPKTIIPSLKIFLASIIFLPFTILSSIWPPSYFISESFGNANFFEKIFRMWYIPILARGKYYFGWFLSEGACNLSGIGYNGYEEIKKGDKTEINMKWDRCRNVNVLGLEFAENMRAVTTHWNTRTGDWLKHYVYLRLTPEGTKPTLTTTTATYAVSAFWHGFYPGYYLFFLQSAILTEVGKDMRRVVRPYFVTITGDNKEIPKPSKIIYDVLSVFFTIMFLNYAGISFLLLSLDKGLLFYGYLNYSGHIISIAILLLLRVIGVGKGGKGGSKGSKDRSISGNNKKSAATTTTAITESIKKID